MIKSNYLTILLSTLFILPLINCKVINEFYIRTFPEDISITFPEGRVISCLANCPEKGCNCFRISRDVTNINCEYDVSDMSKNDKFIYYAVDRYNSTISTGNNLATNAKVTKSSGTESTENPSTTHPWIQFDLTREFTITGIRIQSNKEWTFSEVRVGKQPISEAFNARPFDSNSLCSKKDGGQRGFQGYDIVQCKPCPLVGRYLVIQKQTSKDDYQLSADSVQIFGFETLFTS
ncbi:uncharacterized protein LOC128394919 [Panonychus citri]|uniref:uncharacterized protein LOC128394919 n=1 Tax=Panonychus citri TaxID=50023 RepID=UPI002307FAFC|nr:uncharacterized protein LOC128394919 [Panonychus citri]